MDVAGHQAEDRGTLIGFGTKSFTYTLTNVCISCSIPHINQTPDGTFVLQEIYGIAGTTAGGSNATDSTAEEGDDMSTSECVVCLTNKRELAILPCRHMCVCRACAAECIQSQDSRCPICRNRTFQGLPLFLSPSHSHTHTPNSGPGLAEADARRRRPAPPGTRCSITTDLTRD